MAVSKITRSDARILLKIEWCLVWTDRRDRRSYVLCYAHQELGKDPETLSVA